MIAKQMGASKKKEDGVVDMEQQFILRLPPGPAMALRHDVQSGAMNLKDKLSIELLPETRRGKVTYGGQIFNAKLVDLPCILESLKTTDRKSFYKTADLCQMLVCMTDDEDCADEVESPKKKDKDKKYLWNHGICPPLKNVLRRRFRKTLQKKYQDQPDIEKEVKRLFSMDSQALDIQYEIVIEEEKSHEMEMEQEDKKDLLELDRGITGNYAEHDIFGEVSSSDEDGDREVNILDSGDEGLLNVLTQHDPMADSLPPLDYSIVEPSSDPDVSELHDRLKELNQQLADLHERRISKEMEISILDYSSEKDRLQRELDMVIEEESNKQQEHMILNSMLNQ